MVLDFGLLNSNLFPASDASGEGMGGDPNTIIWNDVGIGIVPIGAIVAWAKSISAGVPPLLPSFVECNGQVLVDGDSPLNGATIPDLNGSSGAQRFLRGNTSSGGTGGAEQHGHGTTQVESGSGPEPNINAYTQQASHLPSYYEVVWVMRVK